LPEAISARVVRVRSGRATSERDDIAVERPLQIRIRLGDDERVLTTTMRTPGHDAALALGFLFAEGVLSGAELDAVQIAETADDDDDVVRVCISSAGEIAHAQAALRGGAERRFVTSAACGVCGRDNVAALMEVGTFARDPDRDRRPVTLSSTVLQMLPQRLREKQSTFSRTGGLHAAGAFTLDGMPLAVFEDVGRHNAVDKLVGTCLRDRQIPMDRAVLMVSGRASFELAQKAARAGFPILAAVGAPSSLAIEIAQAASMTLLGFVREGGFNIYCGAERLNDLATIPDPR
jgi:FdhD protein